MARPRRVTDPPTPTPPAPGWAALTWDDLEAWSDPRSVERGRSYQRGGRVRNLAITADGALLATVVGTERYATTVELEADPDGPGLDSTCTCPIGDRCKHAVAVVAEYLGALAAGRATPAAAVDDERWDDLGVAGHAHPARTSATTATATDWDGRIERHLRGKTQAELADLAWSLVRRFPEVYQEIRDRLDVESGDVGRLLAELRRDIRQATVPASSRHGWDDDEDGSPNYDPIRQRFERLVELGQHDLLAPLGRDLIDRGITQIEEAGDEGETLDAFAECLPVVFQAVAGSSLTMTEKLLFAIDAELADDYDYLRSAPTAVFDLPATTDDWSSVADRLRARLEPGPPADFHAKYVRDRLTRWIARALDEAGRDGEIRTLYEAEVAATGSYERLVSHLQAVGDLASAERRAREGIAALAGEQPGTANHLAKTLAELARGRRQWDVVAAHQARPFFDHPTPAGFTALIEAARQAGVEAAVRQAAVRFLETGIAPFRVEATKPQPTPSGPQRVRAATGRRRRPDPSPPPAPTPPTPPARVEVDPAWPLPVPDELVALLARSRPSAEPRPHHGVLLDLALAAGQTDEVVRWYDQIRSTRPAFAPRPGVDPTIKQVAAAVAATDPDWVIGVIRDALNAQLVHANPTAYEAVVAYLKLLQPIFQAIDQPDDWTRLVATIRDQHRNRPKLKELLDRLGGQTIVQGARPKRP